VFAEGHHARPSGAGSPFSDRFGSTLAVDFPSPLAEFSGGPERVDELIAFCSEHLLRQPSLLD
jgi:hypothetical protein